MGILRIWTKLGYIEGNIVYLLGNWAYPLFWAGADSEHFHDLHLEKV